MTKFIFVFVSTAAAQAEACSTLHSEFSRLCLTSVGVSDKEAMEIFMSSWADKGDTSEVSEETSDFEGKEVIVVRKDGEHVFFYDDCPID